MHKQPVRKAVGAIAYRGDQFLLVHKVTNTSGNRGVWDFPKGGVDPGDTSLEEAVLRELIEETGTDRYVIKQELPEKITFHFDEGLRKKTGYESQETTMFLVEFIGDETDLKPCGGEIDEIALVGSDSLLHKLSHEETAAYVRKLLKM